ncbi:MAG: PIN domain-containing protein [Fimbriimonadales bacterium]|nr:PIN domain-containing protein [Fimbriimonadales bacterium]
MSRDWLLLDTSGLYCALDKADRRHAQATEWLQSTRWKMVHSYVLAELVALARARGVPVQTVVDFSLALMQQPLIEVVWVDETLHRAALALLKHRTDKGYSLCDAVSFVLMQNHAIQDALTTDKHFAQEGFVRLLED